MRLFPPPIALFSPHSPLKSTDNGSSFLRHTRWLRVIVLFFLLLSNHTVCAEGSKTITWGSGTINKTYTISCDTVYTISEGNATDIAGWMTFSTSTSCQIRVTIQTIQNLRASGGSYDYLYVSNGSTGSSTSSPIATTPWYKGQNISKTVTSSGNVVTIYFNNGFNSGNKTHNSEFLIHVECIGCLDCVKIGDGFLYTSANNGSYAPIYTRNNYYAYTQQLYTAAELRAQGACDGILGTIKFHYAGTTSKTATFDLYIGQTTSATVPNSWITNANLRRVFSGPITFTTANDGWTSINVRDSNWQWDGTSNIVVEVHRTSNANAGKANFYYTSIDGMVRYYSQNTTSVSLNSNNVPAANGSNNSQRPDIKFCFDCCEKLTSPKTFSLSSTEGSVRVNNDIAVPVTNNTGCTITWNSSNTTVATVAGGTVHGEAAGDATITATLSGCETFCDTTLSYSVHVTSCSLRDGDFSFANPTHTMTAGTSYTNPFTNTTGIDPEFTISPTGPTINSSTGEVSPAVGTEGTFTITATIPASGEYCEKTTSYTLTINDGCTKVGDDTKISNYAPLYGTWLNSYVEIIYPQSEIGSYCRITSIAFNAESANSVTRHTRIWVGQTTKTAFDGSGDFQGANTMTPVYEGDWNISAGWNTFNFTMPFDYTAGNLIVGIECNASGAASTRFYSTNMGYLSIPVLYSYHDTYAPTPNDMTTWCSNYAYSYSYDSYRPNIKVCMTCCEERPGTLSFEEDSHVLTPGGTYTNTLTNGTGETVTYSIEPSGSGVTINSSSGQVTAAANAVGRFIVTASVAASGDYCEKTDSYTLTVTTGCAQIGDGSTPSGSGNEGTYGGLFTYNRCEKSYTQQVYTAAELTAAGACAGNITSIALHYATSTSYNFPFKIYMGQKANASLSSDWVTDAGLVEVYSTDNLSFSTGWNTIPVSGFSWDGSSDIVVAIYRTNYYADGASIYPDFYHTNTENMCRTTHSNDPQLLDHLDSEKLPVKSNGTSISGWAHEQRPEIKFCFDCVGCNLEATIEFGE